MTRPKKGCTLCAMALTTVVGAAAACGTGATTGGNPLLPAPDDASEPDTGADGGVDAQPLDAGCTPGAVVTEDCGNCGKRTKTCNAQSVFAAGPCTGEPANGCKPGTVDYTTAGCVTPSTFRNRTCGPACTFGNYSATCAPK